MVRFMFVCVVRLVVGLNRFSVVNLDMVGCDGVCLFVLICCRVFRMLVLFGVLFR